MKRPLGRIFGSVHSGSEQGRASRTLQQSISEVLLCGTMVFQIVLILVALEPTGSRPGAEWWLFIGHGCAAALSAAAWRGRIHPAFAIVAVDAMFLADWAAASAMASPLLFAACWARNLSAAVPTVALRGRAAIVLPLLTLVGLASSMRLTRPELGWVLPVSVCVTGMSILIVTRIGVSFLFEFAAQADSQSAAAESDRRLAATRRRASSDAAEDARLLHDTVINTLAAIASGGAAVTDADMVRQRCLADVGTVEALQRGEGVLVTDDDLRAPFPVPGVAVTHTGIDDAQLTSMQAQLAPVRLIVLRRAVVELVQNVAKHAGVAECEVQIVGDRNKMVVTVSDQGRGFVPQNATTRGLATSVAARAEEVGIDVQIESTPGQGTTVRLISPFGPIARDESEPHDSFLTIVAVLHRRAGFLFAAGLVGVGLILALGNHYGRPTPEYLMVGITGLAGFLAWRAARNMKPLSPLMTNVLTATSVAAFLLTGAAVDFGRSEPVVWQAIAATGPLILILLLAPSRRSVARAIGIFCTVVVGTAAWVAIAPNHSSEPRGWPVIIILIAGLTAVGLVGGWAVFLHTTDVIGARVADDERAAGQARWEVAAREASDAARGRWRKAGLARSLALLRRVGEGTADPTDPDVQRSCAAEEEHLRQLTLLNPSLTSFSTWLAQALDTARSQDVTLRIRTGDTDVDDQTANSWGRVVLQAVEKAPSGSRLDLSLFPSGPAARLTLIGPAAQVEHAAAEGGSAAGTTDPLFAVDVLQDIGILESVAASALPAAG